MKRFLYTIAALILLSSCGSTIKSRWTNFTAYYNTFYNARQSYKSGLEKVLAADISFNPQLPIRIHEIPVNSGAQDFQKAIEKSAEILRKFPESKWVDDALFLIARSYYFRSDFFSSDQKYQELYRVTEDPSLKQQAVIWRARLLLDMDLAVEGINFVNARIYSEDIQWTPEQIAELRAVLAQLYVAAGEYELAIYELESSLYLLEPKKYKERGFFLLAQLSDLTGDPESALYAYEQVGEYYFDYELQYLARRKRAETARKIGAYDQAVRTLEEMVRDDKNVEFRSELDYELARTLQESREYEEAKALYERILYQRLSRLNTLIKAKTYNGLAEVYQFGYNNYRLAAAYYDSAAQQNVAQELLPPDFKAGELARYYGRYVEAKDEIHYRDSLLWVASLDRGELDNLIIDIRRKKLQNLEAERRRQEQEQNTLVNIIDQNSGTTTQGSGSFLNYSSPALRASAEARFYSVWGDRPLVDNWRVRAAYESAIFSDDQTGSRTNRNFEQGALSTVDLSIDLSVIPYTREEQDSVRRELATLHFELGNLFYLSIQNMDSAAYYFETVILNYPESEETAISYYSLSKMYSEIGMMNEAEHFARELVFRYPETQYASKVSGEYGIDLDLSPEEGDQLISLAREIIADTSGTQMEKASLLSGLYRKNLQSEYAEEILLESALLFTEAGKQYPSYQQAINNWVRNGAGLRNGSITDSVSLTMFPFEGAAWDSARVQLLKFTDGFPGSAKSDRVRRLLKEIQKPDSETSGDSGEGTRGEDQRP